MKKVMVIAGGTWQVPLIQKLKEMGHIVINSNLYEDSPGFEYADYTGVMDVRDKEKNLELAKKYDIDAVLTDQSDIAVPTVAYVADQIGCPGIGQDMAELFTNKFQMREFCRKHGLPYPKYKLCSNVDEAVAFYRTLHKKAIMKPLDSQSSRGVFTIHNEQDLLDNFAESMQYTNQGSSVLVEEYIDGTEFTVDGIAINGVHHTLAISQKEHYSYNENVASKLYFTNTNPEYDYDKLRALDDALVNKSGITFALTHAEYKYENGEFYLIEIAARGGGTRISSDIVPFMSGVDNYKILIDAALGTFPEDDHVYMPKLDITKDRVAILKFLDIDSKGKRIQSIEGVDAINSIPEMRKFQLEFHEGDIVEQAKDDRSRVGFFIACANSRERMDEIEKLVDEKLKITFE